MICHIAKYDMPYSCLTCHIAIYDMSSSYMTCHISIYDMSYSNICKRRNLPTNVVGGWREAPTINTPRSNFPHWCTIGNVAWHDITDWNISRAIMIDHTLWEYARCLFVCEVGGHIARREHTCASSPGCYTPPNGNHIREYKAVYAYIHTGSPL